jgi:hypothetical protein
MHAQFHAEDVRQLGTGDQARISITATITNTGTEPITLDPQAVGVWDGATALPLHDESTPLPRLLPPESSTRLTLIVDDSDHPAALTVQLGLERWRVQLP